jgi:hypothetical protein
MIYINDTMKQVINVQYSQKQEINLWTFALERRLEK